MGTPGPTWNPPASSAWPSPAAAYETWGSTLRPHHRQRGLGSGQRRSDQLPGIRLRPHPEQRFLSQPHHQPAQQNHRPVPLPAPQWQRPDLHHLDLAGPRHLDRGHRCHRRQNVTAGQSTTPWRSPSPAPRFPPPSCSSASRRPLKFSGQIQTHQQRTPTNTYEIENLTPRCTWRSPSLAAPVLQATIYLQTDLQQYRMSTLAAPQRADAS